MAGLPILFRNDFPSEFRSRFVGCVGSFAFHLALLAMAGLWWLEQPARFHVQSGETSMEIELVTEPKPVSVATPTPPKSKPLPPVPMLAPSLPAPIPAPRRSLAKPAASRAAHVVKSVRAEPSAASQGAISAQPDALQNAPPVYPEESRAAREQGTVLLRVEVTVEGIATDVHIEKSSGYFRLDQAARRAVANWKFHPAQSAGTPISSEAEVPVNFVLH